MLNICLLIGGCDAVVGNFVVLKDSARISLTQRCWQSLPYMVFVGEVRSINGIGTPGTNENDTWRACKTH